jgi:DNA helicase II / ATP-dependent DNA helicase PcrA
MARRTNLKIIDHATSETVPAVPAEPRYRLLSEDPSVPGFPASLYQAAIFDVMPDPRSGSFVVKAVAGAGKTTVLKNALRYLPAGANVQGFAFNTDAAASLKAALEEVTRVDGPERYKNVRMGTFHSVCYGVLLRHLGKRADQVKPDGGKMRRLLKKRLIEADMELYGSFVARLVGLAKGEGIGALVPSTVERWYALIDHHGLSLDAEEATEERAVEIAAKALAYSNHVAKESADIDFDDMLYLPLLWKLRLWQNDVVFVDEAQDTNPVRRAIARLALKRDGRLFAVGDPRQSIYGFTGASTDAMELITREFKTRELPLTVSYRCARSVVERARGWVDYIEPAETAPEGEVRDGVPLAEALGILRDEDAILCRQTAPLVDLAYQLIAKGRGCKILGKDVAEGLLSLIAAQKARGIERLIKKIEAWRDREVARWTAKGEDGKADAVADRAQCILTVIAALPETERTISALERSIRRTFRLDENGDAPAKDLLTLATIHKSKGLEWDTVAILRPDLMPGRARVDWQEQQEINLMYVAATRAKLTLLYLKTE